MGWYLLNLRQAKISADRQARLHKVDRKNSCFCLRGPCNPGDQISGKDVGLFLFEAKDDVAALGKAKAVVRKLIGNGYGVKECDKCW
jgi:hypothetical protein